MSISSGQPQTPVDQELQRRIHDLENEVQMLRLEFEAQSRRMAQLVLENSALKMELGKDPAARESAREAARKANRNRASLVTREEMEYALTMGRGMARPSPETLRRR